MICCKKKNEIDGQNYNFARQFLNKLFKFVVATIASE